MSAEFKFPEVFCSQCGEGFGPGDNGFSHCESHAGLFSTERTFWSRHPELKPRIDSVTRLRMYAEDLHSAGGFNGYANAMSLGADEIIKLREYAVTIEADLVATIDQRDELGADKARWMRMAEVFAKQAAEYKEKCTTEYDKGYTRGVETTFAKIKEEQQRCYVSK